MSRLDELRQLNHKLLEQLRGIYEDEGASAAAQARIRDALQQAVRQLGEEPTRG